MPTDLLLAAKAHVDNVIRESTLASGGRTGLTTGVLPPLVSLLGAVVEPVRRGRLEIKRQALEAYCRGEATTRLTRDLPASTAKAAEDYASLASTRWTPPTTGAGGC